MTDVDVPAAEQLDEMSLARPGSPSRDRGRTPMPWTAQKNGGFTPGTARPWLPLGDHSVINVQSEREDPSSVLGWWRELAALRASGRIGTVGPLERVLLDDQVWAFRVGTATTVVNLSARPATRELGTDRSLPDQVLSVLISSGPLQPGSQIAGKILLEPWEALVAVPA
jgi:glycosidase